MTEKTSGIIIHTIKHSDKAHITTIYTEKFGRVSYIVYGLNNKKSKFRSAFFQPLTIIEMDVNHIPGKEIQQIKDIQIKYPYTSIHKDPIKNAILLFISEVLYKCLQQEETDNQLFLFLENTLLQMDLLSSGIQNFHLVFLCKLSRYLGFEPDCRHDEHMYCFDLTTGTFCNNSPLHSHIIKKEDCGRFILLMQADFGTMEQVVLKREQRITLLEKLLEYYQLHLHGIREIHSIKILQTIFN